MYCLLFFTTLVGLSLCDGGIFPMNKKEIESSMEIKNGVELGVEKLNMKNERQENDFR